MKYEKMVCWVDKEEEKLFPYEKIIDGSIYIAKDSNDFISHLSNNTFPVISVLFLDDNIFDIIKNFPKLRIFLLENTNGAQPIPEKVFSYMFISNIFPDLKKRYLYTITGLMNLFEGQHTIE